MLHCDVETKSILNLREVNAYVYFEHPSTDVHCMAWAFDNDEPELWLPGQPVPEAVRARIEGGGELVIWNAQFERLCFNHVLGPKHGWPVPKLEQYTCAMAMAYAMAIPGALDMAGPVLGLDQHKDQAGGRIMLQLAKPRKKHADGRVDWYTPGTHPEKFEKLYAYNLQDVRTEQAAYNRLMQLRPQEKEIWRLDQVVNDRGLYVDDRLCGAALKVVDACLAKLNAEIAKVTDYAVTALSNTAQLTAWVRSRGVVTEGLAKDDLAELLVRDDLPADVKRALEIRQEGAKTSTAKVDKMLTLRMADGRMRGNLQYHGAATGRWAARGAQIQNFPRPSTKDVGSAIDVLLTGKLEMVEMFYDRPMQVVSDCLRGMIAAAPGHRLLDADFSAIEARVIAWLAGEQTVLKAFREQDAKTGPDVYKVNASGIYNKKPADVDDSERQVGKVACIAEGQQVLTDTGLVAIEKITKSHRVWDGENFVSHDGVVFQGVREVIEYDGLIATPDHIVFTEDGRNLRFGECARQQIGIVQTGLGRAAIRLGQSDFAPCDVAGRQGQARPPVSVSTLSDGMHGLRHTEMDQRGQSSARYNQGLPGVLEAKACSDVADETPVRSEKPLRVPYQQAVCRIRRAWHSLRLPFGFGSRAVGDGEFGSSEGHGNRPDRQQRELCSGQSSLGGQRNPDAQSAPDQGEAAPGLGEPVFAIHDIQNAPRWHVEGRDICGSGTGSSGEAKKLAHYRGEARVYDILNCGPNHRFTVSGKLVHNCLSLGYQGGPSAFKKMAANYKVDVAAVYDSVWETATTKNRAKAQDGWRARGKSSGIGERAWIASELIKLAWRDSNPAIVKFWWDLEAAAIKAVETGETAHVGLISFKKAGSWLFCRLPSGRCLTYAYPKIVQKEMPWTDDNGNPVVKPSLVFKGVNGVTRKWEETGYYGGYGAENVTQAVARDLMAEAMVRVEKAGYPVVGTIHDEILCEVPNGFGSLEEFSALMAKTPDWAGDLPVSVGSWEAARFRK